MLVYPGDPELGLEVLSEVAPAESVSYRLSRLTLSTHAGTHVDAPSHMVAGGVGIDQVSLERLCGPARVASLEGAGSRIGAAELESLELDGVERLLLRTDSGGCFERPFDAGHAHLALDGARYLLEHTDVRLIGIDSLSVEGASSKALEVHRALLGADPPRIIVEGLDLRAAAPGDWELFCLPLRLADADGAPARAVLVRR